MRGTQNRHGDEFNITCKQATKVLFTRTMKPTIGSTVSVSLTWVKIGPEPILTIDNFDGDFDGPIDTTCEQSFRVEDVYSLVITQEEHIILNLKFAWQSESVWPGKD